MLTIRDHGEWDEVVTEWTDRMAELVALLEAHPSARADALLRSFRNGTTAPAPWARFMHLLHLARQRGVNIHITPVPEKELVQLEVCDCRVDPPRCWYSGPMGVEAAVEKGIEYMEANHG